MPVLANQAPDDAATHAQLALSKHAVGFGIGWCVGVFVGQANTPRRLPLGLEMCVKTMFSGEECEVKLSPQYSGPLVTPNYTLPSETSTTWRVKLREVNLHPARAFPPKAERVSAKEKA